MALTNKNHVAPEPTESTQTLVLTLSGVMIGTYLNGGLEGFKQKLTDLIKENEECEFIVLRNERMYSREPITLGVDRFLAGVYLDEELDELLYRLSGVVRATETKKKQHDRTIKAFEKQRELSNYETQAIDDFLSLVQSIQMLHVSKGKNLDTEKYHQLVALADQLILKVDTP